MATAVHVTGGVAGPKVYTDCTCDSVACAQHLKCCNDHAMQARLLQCMVVIRSSLWELSAACCNDPPGPL